MPTNCELHALDPCIMTFLDNTTTRIYLYSYHETLSVGLSFGYSSNWNYLRHEIYFAISWKFWIYWFKLTAWLEQCSHESENRAEMYLHSPYIHFHQMREKGQVAAEKKSKCRCLDSLNGCTTLIVYIILQFCYSRTSTKE